MRTATTAVAAGVAVAVLAGCGGSTSEVTVTRTTSTPATTSAVVTTAPAPTTPDTAPLTTAPVTTAPAPETDPQALTRDYTQADLRLIDGVGLSARQCRRREPDRAAGERSYIVCVTGRVTTVYVRFTGRAAVVRDWKDDRDGSDVQEPGFTRDGCDDDSRTLGTWSNSGVRRGRFYCGLLKSGGGANIGWTYTDGNVTAFAFSPGGEISLAALHRWWQTKTPSSIG